MHPSGLLIAFLIAAAGLVCEAEAQPCYKKTDEHVKGGAFVKPMSDSTCFGQWDEHLCYYNYKTGDTLFRFICDAYYPYPHFGYAEISDVLMFDSLLVVNWEAGAVYRILKVDFRGIVSEIPSALDRIPMLKYAGDAYGDPTHKLAVVNDSVFLMSNNRSIYSFYRSVDTVACVDSMAMVGNWDALDVYRDSIVVVSTFEHEARFYNVDAKGKIAYSGTLGFDKDVYFVVDVYLRNGLLYIGDGSRWRALVRMPEGYQRTSGSSVSAIQGLMPPLFGTKNIVIVDHINDGMWIYDREFNLFCYKAPSTSYAVIACGIYEVKVFLATPEGISTWIPDTSTTSIASPPVVNRPAEIDVWPNPSASGIITVRSEEPATAIELTDVSGRVVYRAYQQGSGETIIPTAFLTAGVYFVNAHTAQGIMRERVVILGMRD